MPEEFERKLLESLSKFADENPRKFQNESLKQFPEAFIRLFQMNSRKKMPEKTLPENAGDSINKLQRSSQVICWKTPKK